MVYQTNPIPDGYIEQFNPVKTVCWTEPGLTVTRLRLIGDPGYPWLDVSYCHGRLNGEDVRVSLPFSDLPKNSWKAAIVKNAKKDKVYATKLGIISDENVSILV